ncbi:regucalcin-like [Penaeus japonicus]|uniref:regucalcin-like n=1 Tax=Penaeus japonicus TaxID=27405 RepID=UPI001C711312|nr:regucalcin-like [Penaeus japonicus]
MSGVEIKQVAPSVRLGEGPHWVEEDQALLFVDIVEGDVHRLFLETGRHQVLHVEADESGSAVSLVIPVEGARDLFLVGLGRSLAVVRWAASDPDRHTVKAEVVLHTIDHHCPTNRFNDGKCDPRGRLWAGKDGEGGTGRGGYKDLCVDLCG